MAELQHRRAAALAHCALQVERRYPDEPAFPSEGLQPRRGYRPEIARQRLVGRWLRAADPLSIQAAQKASPSRTASSAVQTRSRSPGSIGAPRTARAELPVSHQPSRTGGAIAQFAQGLAPRTGSRRAACRSIVGAHALKFSQQRSSCGVPPGSRATVPHRCARSPSAGARLDPQALVPGRPRTTPCRPSSSAASLPCSWPEPASHYRRPAPRFDATTEEHGFPAPPNGGRMRVLIVAPHSRAIYRAIDQAGTGACQLSPLIRAPLPHRHIRRTIPPARSRTDREQALRVPT